MRTSRKERDHARWMNAIYPSKRRRRLCARSGHRFSRWWGYMTSNVTFSLTSNDTPTHQRENGECRSCSRCGETQYRNVEMDDRPFSMVAWSDDEPRDPWQANPDEWKEGAD